VEKILGLVVLWIGLCVLTLMLGGKGLKSILGITCKSSTYPVVVVAQFLWTLGFSVVYGRKLNRDQKNRIAVNYPFYESDPIWDWSTLKTFGIYSFIAGVVGGLIGIAGGMILGPIMLVMGIDPRVSTAANATMIILTSSTVAVMFVTSGQVPLSHALFFFSVCLVGAYLGKSKIDGYIKKTGRASILIFILASIIAFAAVGCLVIMVIGLADKDWCFEGFQKFCVVSNGGGCVADRALQFVAASFVQQ